MGIHGGYPMANGRAIRHVKQPDGAGDRESRAGGDWARLRSGDGLGWRDEHQQSQRPPPQEKPV